MWQFDQVPGDIGCVGPDAVTDIGPAQIFVGRGDIFYFDGTRPISIAEGQVRQWFYTNASQQYLYKTTVIHDKQANLVWIYYPSVFSTGGLDSALVYHLGRKQWGQMSINIESACNYISSGLTFDTLPGTFDTLPDVGYDSQYWLSGGRLTTVVTTAHQLSSMTGVSGNTSMTMVDVGDDAAVSRLKRVRVSYSVEPTSATIAGFSKMSRGAVTSTGATGVYSAGKFDLQQSGRYHRVRVDAMGNWGASAVDFDLVAAGQR